MFYKYHVRKQNVGGEGKINDADFQTVREILGCHWYKEAVVSLSCPFMITSDILHGNEFKVELLHSLFTFLEMTHATKTFWYLQFLTNTPFQVQNQTHPSKHHWQKQGVRKLVVCLISFEMKCSSMGCEYAASYFSIMKCNTIDWTAVHWQIWKHICMLTFSSALLPLLKDQQKQKKMQHVLNIDKPELYPGRDS